MLVFEERGKPEFPEKNLSEQSREPTNSAHIWRRVRESNPGHIGGRRALSPLHQPCSLVELAWGRVELLGDLLVARAWEEILGFPLWPRKLQWRARWAPSHLQQVCLNDQSAQSPPRWYLKQYTLGRLIGDTSLVPVTEVGSFLTGLWDRSQSSQRTKPQEREVAWDWRKNLTFSS